MRDAEMLVEEHYDCDNFETDMPPNDFDCDDVPIRRYGGNPYIVRRVSMRLDF